MLQSAGVELKEVIVPQLKFVNEDDIALVEVLESNKTTTDKAPLIYICPACSGKYKQQISYGKHVSQCELQEDDTVTNEAHKFTDDNCPMLVRFLVSTRLYLTLKTEKGRSNLKWYKTLWKTWYHLCVAVGW